MQVTFEFFDGDIIFKLSHWLTNTIYVLHDAFTARTVINDLIWSLVCFIIIFEMKYYHKSKLDRQLMLNKLLYLRYKTSTPNKGVKPMALIPMSLVSLALKVPLHSLQWMERSYFNPQKSRSKSEMDKLPALN